MKNHDQRGEGVLALYTFDSRHPSNTSFQHLAVLEALETTRRGHAGSVPQLFILSHPWQAYFDPVSSSIHFDSSLLIAKNMSKKAKKYQKVIYNPVKRIKSWDAAPIWPTCQKKKTCQNLSEGNNKKKQTWIFPPRSPKVHHAGGCALARERCGCLVVKGLGPGSLGEMNGKTTGKPYEFRIWANFLWHFFRVLFKSLSANDESWAMLQDGGSQTQMISDGHIMSTKWQSDHCFSDQSKGLQHIFWYIVSYNML